MDNVQIQSEQAVVGSGSIGSRLLAHGGNYDALRPFVGSDGRSYISVANGKFKEDGSPVYEARVVHNAGAVLSKNEWQYLDNVLVKVAKPRLKLVNLMRAGGMARTFPQAYNHSVYQYERITDVDAASISMSPKSRGTNDRAAVDIVNMPLPIIHKEFSFEAREIAISRNNGQPLSTVNLELGAARVADAIESLVLGTWGSYTYGGGVLYGLTNFPSRTTGGFLNPTVSGWTPFMLYNSVIKMMQDALAVNQFGPFDLYYSTGLMQYMLRMMTDQYGSGSLLKNIKEIPNLVNVEMLDFLTGNQLLLVQRNPATASVLVGMDMKLVQWVSDGGETENFRIMAMILPLIQTDASSQCGIIHYSGNATTV